MRTALVAGVIVCGAVLRLVIYRSAIGELNGDEAVWGLMARQATHGHISAFYWSQVYGGTQEVLLVALLFLAFGTHLVLMRLVPMALAAVSAIVLWRVGRRTVGELPGLVAGLLLWIWPPFLLWKLQIWHGFYGSGLLYACLVLLLVLRLEESPSKREVAVFGLVLGLAFWQTLQIVAVLVPALIWLTVRRPGVWRWAWLAVPGVVVGSLPWLLSNLRHDWWSFQLPGAYVPYVTKLHTYATDIFPQVVGLRVPLSTEWLFGKIPTFLLYLAALVLFAVFGWRWRRTQLSLFVVVMLVYPFIFALSGLTWLSIEPRYAVLVVPAVVVLIAKAATTLARATAMLAIAAVLSVVVIAKWIDWRHDIAPAAAFDPHYVNVGPAIKALDRAGVDRAYADYWVAYRMTFLTRERIIVSEADLTNLAPVGRRRVLPPVPTTYTESRHPAYDTAVRKASRYAYVLVAGQPAQRRDVRLLLAHRFREEKLGTVLVLFSSPQRA